VQLAISIPALRQYVSNTVIEHSDIASRSLHDQWCELVLRPFSKLDGNDCQSLYIVVVDALDECDGGNDIQIILNLLAEVRSLEKVGLRVFLRSRAEVPIRNGSIQIPGTEHQDFVLHNISPSIVDHDIRIFLEHNLNLIAQEHLKQETLGNGTFAVVRHLWDVSTGLEYAYKEPRDKRRFDRKLWKKEADIMGQISHVR
jgi:hypothetical protein